MLNRIAEGIYYLFLILAVVMILFGSIHAQGWIGVFTAIGVVIVAMMVMALFESIIKWLVHGQFEFPPK